MTWWGDSLTCNLDAQWWLSSQIRLLSGVPIHQSRNCRMCIIMLALSCADFQSRSSCRSQSCKYVVDTASAASKVPQEITGSRNHSFAPAMTMNLIPRETISHAEKRNCPGHSYQHPFEGVFGLRELMWVRDIYG